MYFFFFFFDKYIGFYVVFFSIFMVCLITHTPVEKYCNSQFKFEMFNSINHNISHPKCFNLDTYLLDRSNMWADTLNGLTTLLYQLINNIFNNQQQSICIFLYAIIPFIFSSVYLYMSTFPQ